MPLRIILVFLVALHVTGCSDTKNAKKSTASGMKCGAGKCGANMFNASSVLGKKKNNILSQMREDDPRKNCVTSAKTTKALYNCVRDPKTGKLTTKCGKMDMQSGGTMKSQAGKCG
ncbi:MAG: hypothetical protein FAF05_05885 [Epsilonproteobacteria bacterium]|nr:hypothetical protein [Campylobacterota bacterium]